MMLMRMAIEGGGVRGAAAALVSPANKSVELEYVCISPLLSLGHTHHSNAITNYYFIIIISSPFLDQLQLLLAKQIIMSNDHQHYQR